MSQHARHNPEETRRMSRAALGYRVMDHDDEPSLFRKRQISCSDRMCGAVDCPNCHPEGIESEDEP